MPENDMRRIQRRDIAEALGLLTRLPVRSSAGTRGVKAGWAWPSGRRAGGTDRRDSGWRLAVASVCRQLVGSADRLR